MADITPELDNKMNVDPTEVRYVMKKLLYAYVTERNRRGCCNFTNPYVQEQEEIAASLFILIVVGFFGFLLFSMMLSNIVHRPRENYMDYMYRDNFKGNAKRPSCKTTLPAAAAHKVTPEPSPPGQCQKNASCTIATEVPSAKSVVRMV